MNKTCLVLFAALTFPSALAASPNAKDESPLVITNRAFVLFHETREEQENASEDDMEAGGDLAFYLDKIRAGFALKHPEIKFITSSKKRIQLGKNGKFFERHKTKAGFGFIFFEPGKEPRIEEGVMTDEDAFCIAEKYWDISFGDELCSD